MVTGQVDCYIDKVSFGLVLPYEDDGSKLSSATASFARFVCNRADIFVIENNCASYATYSDYLVVSAAGPTNPESAGIFSLHASRPMPRYLLTASERMDSLVGCIIKRTEIPEVY